MSQNGQQVFSLEGKTSGGRVARLPPTMQEQSAAIAWNDGATIGAKHDDDVIKRIAPPELLMAEGVWAPYQLVISGVIGRVGPPIPVAYRLTGQNCGRPGHTVGPIEHLFKVKRPDGRGPIPFDFAL